MKPVEPFFVVKLFCSFGEIIKHRKGLLPFPNLQKKIHPSWSSRLFYEILITLKTKSINFSKRKIKMPELKNVSVKSEGFKKQRLGKFKTSFKKLILISCPGNNIRFAI